MTYDDAMKHCIFRYVSGSHAYGTNRPPCGNDPGSDEDIRGVFIAPINAAFDLFHSAGLGGGSAETRLKTALENLEKYDCNAAVENIKAAMEPDIGDLGMSVRTVHHPGKDEELHELRNFLKLIAQNNPNTIEALYIDRLIKQETDVWKRIKAKRDLFLSKKVRWTFSGFVYSQAKRIETHRAYLLNPPTHKPTREEFELEQETLIAKENKNAILSIPDKWITEGVKDYIRREKKYKDAMDSWVAYQKWDKERNPARKEMERKYGYDCKFAVHLVRLSRMSKEILRDGVVNVYRPDREELKSIVRGEWKYEEIVALTKTLDQELDVLYKASKLRDKPDFKGISDLYVSICEEHYGIKIK